MKETQNFCVKKYMRVLTEVEKHCNKKIFFLHLHSFFLGDRKYQYLFS